MMTRKKRREKARKATNRYACDSHEGFEITEEIVLCVCVFTFENDLGWVL